MQIYFWFGFFYTHCIQRTFFFQVSLSRVAAFTKRLCQLCLIMQESECVATLVVLRSFFIVSSQMLFCIFFSFLNFFYLGASSIGNIYGRRRTNERSLQAGIGRPRALQRFGNDVDQRVDFVRGEYFFLVMLVRYSLISQTRVYREVNYR